jgi:hypothetical protein
MVFSHEIPSFRGGGNLGVTAKGNLHTFHNPTLRRGDEKHTPSGSLREHFTWWFALKQTQSKYGKENARMVATMHRSQKRKALCSRAFLLLD